MEISEYYKSGVFFIYFFNQLLNIFPAHNWTEDESRDKEQPTLLGNNYRETLISAPR